MERFRLECLCGHMKRAHYGYPPKVPHHCSFCYNEKRVNALHTFRQDNLKYLEMLSKEKEVADL